MTTEHVKSVVILALLSAAAATSAFADEMVRFHGFRIDDKHMLFLEQRHEVILVRLGTRTRTVGAQEITQTRDERSDVVDRFGEVEDLLELRAEVMKPSAPNYLHNPGERYRVTVKGLGLDPDYISVTEVDALVARDTMLSKIGEISSRSHGIYQTALYYAGPYALQVFNESGLMPAALPTSLKESMVGGIRFVTPALQRKSLEEGRKLHSPRAPEKKPQVPGANKKEKSETKP